jgi:hypothetical protein
MWKLVCAGLLYLFGTAIILLIRPNLMFTEDGSWKEFGIGRNKNTHTWMPFWLFAVLWALTSYILTNIIFAVYYEKDYQPKVSRSTRGKSVELPDGYYIKNTDGSEVSGVPKYIYLGKGLPND